LQLRPRLIGSEGDIVGKAQKLRHKPKKRSRLFTWIAVAAVTGLVLYGVSQMSNITYTEDDIRAVNFSGLDSKQRRTALEAANVARCGCGCGLGLAQCVSTDLTCPIRESNIERIKGMVREAIASVPSS
jgi:hypothetical protein